MTNLIFFETNDELLKLTGLKNEEELWENGFYLDDWDYGFVCDEIYVDVIKDEFDCDEYRLKEDIPFHIYCILNMMEAHCVGYKVNEYKGAFYYMTYHS